jgi:hypothetical protein
VLRDVYVHLKKRFSVERDVVLRKPGRFFGIKNMHKPLSDIKHLPYLELEYSKEPVKWRFSLWDRTMMFLVEKGSFVKFAFSLLLSMLMVLLAYVGIATLSRKQQI